MLEYITNFVAGAEWVWIIVIVGILIFGAKKIPELAKTLGKAKGDYEKGSTENAFCRMGFENIRSLFCFKGRFGR